MVTFVNRHAPARRKEVANVEDVKTECIQLCRLRLALQTSSQRLKANMDRAVPWKAVQKTWKWLSSTIGMIAGTYLVQTAVSDSMYVRWCGKCRFRQLRSNLGALLLLAGTQAELISGDYPVVWTKPADALLLQTDALSRGNHWVKPDAQRPGELWIRFGLDGVPLWKSQVVAGTMAPYSHVRDLKQHTPDRHFVCILFRGYDTKELLKQCLQKSGYLGSVDDLNGSCVTINGTHYVLRLFICGDHMLMYKLTGRDGPTSTRPEPHPCPYCAAPAPDVLNYAARVLAMSLGAEAMFVGIPAAQHAIDCRHGMVNVFYGVCLPVVENTLIDCGWTNKDVNDYFGTLNVDPMLYVVGGEVTGDGLPEFIDNALTFFEKRCYNRIDTTLKLVCHHIIRLDGQDHSKSDLIAAMFEHVAIMVSVAYTREPTLSQVDMCETSARALRRIWKTLDAPTTPWGHVWTAHVPRFLRL